MDDSYRASSEVPRPERSRRRTLGTLPAAFARRVADAVEATLKLEGFRQREYDAKALPEVERLLVRKTWNTNRAVVIATRDSTPENFRSYLLDLRGRAAKQCGYFPFFYGVGLQVVLIAPGLRDAAIDPQSHVAKVDNQWAIIQCLFLVDSTSHQVMAARSWGQVVTGRYQDAIARALRDVLEVESS